MTKRKTAAIHELTPDLVASWRKDFLTLMGNIKRVKTYDDAEKLRVGISKWREFIYDQMQQIRDDVKGRKYAYPPELAVPERELDALIRSLNPVWSFLRSCGSFPMMHYDPKMDRWHPKSMLFANYQRDIDAWEASTKRKAPAAWKALSYAADWAVRHVGGSRRVKVNPKNKENVEVAGFKIQLVGFDDVDAARSRLQNIEPALRHYRERAKKVMPLLLAKQLPLVLNAYYSSNFTILATYETDHISLTPFTKRNDARDNAKTLAHEMGHHVYRAILSAEAVKEWEQIIRGGMVPVDLRDILKAMEKYGPDTTSIDAELEHNDPILALQFGGLLHDPHYEHLDLFNRKNLQEYLDDGKDPIVYVHQVPITAYGAKNPEEAFCEAIGLLVGYGPKTVDPIVVSWLQHVLPGQVTVAAYIPPMERTKKPRRAAAPKKKVDDLVEELTEIVDKNVKDNGKAEEYDPPAFLKDEVEENEERSKKPPRKNPYFNMFGPITPGDSDYDGDEDEPDLSDLDTDFDWDFYEKMYPSKRNWPVRDTAVLYDPAAISRYNVDYFRLVARVARVARVLKTLKS